MIKRLSLVTAATLLWVASATAGLDTATYISNNGDGSGSVSGDMSGVGPVTLMDVQGGDLWNGGDQAQFLHQAAEVSQSFTATVRVVSQTAAVDGRWGKGGLTARTSLDANAAQATTGLSIGNGSQIGGESPVAVRITGRPADDGQGGFETDIPLTAGSTLAGDGADPENVANNWTGTDIGVWLNLEYDANAGTFTSGVANDVNGAPGVWNFSPATTIANDGDGYVVGLIYSAHGDLKIGPGESSEQPDAMHGLTFDNFSINVVPEPSAFALLGLAMCGMLGLRRRR